VAHLMVREYYNSLSSHGGLFVYTLRMLLSKYGLISFNEFEKCAVLANVKIDIVDDCIDKIETFDLSLSDDLIKSFSDKSEMRSTTKNKNGDIIQCFYFVKYDNKKERLLLDYQANKITLTTMNLFAYEKESENIFKNVEIDELLNSVFYSPALKYDDYGNVTRTRLGSEYGYEKVSMIDLGGGRYSLEKDQDVFYSKKESNEEIVKSHKQSKVDGITSKRYHHASEYEKMFSDLMDHIYQLNGNKYFI
jgi:hypothetical protein